MASNALKWLGFNSSAFVQYDLACASLFICDADAPNKYSTSALFGASRCAASRWLRASTGRFTRRASSALPTSFCAFGL